MMLTKLSLDTQLDREFMGRHEPNVCRSRRCRTFAARIGEIMKTFDYINRVMITLPLMIYEGAWTTLFPSHCYVC